MNIFLQLLSTITASLAKLPTLSELFLCFPRAELASLSVSPANRSLRDRSTLLLSVTLPHSLGR